MDVRKWLCGLGLEQYADLFAENRIGADVLPELTEADLKDLDIPLGDRKRLLRAAASLPAILEQGAGPVQPAGAERRHLTVMFCDLVGSTALSTRLDPEELRDVLRAYQEVCAEAVGRFDGHIAKYIGDGLLVYFGYPRAHEDDPRRAVKAGLVIVDRIASLNRSLADRLDTELATRIGIDTGLVVVGEMGGGETREADAIVGETPNIAARLQDLAAPNTVAISDATRQLVEGLFEFDALGAKRLKGVSHDTPVFGVVGERAIQSRLDLAADRGLTPLVGRDEEIALLMKRWQQAQDGDSQVVLLSSEAGVGKSRVVRAFRERLQDDAHNRILYYCSAYHRNSAFYPASDQAERALRFERDDSVEAKLDKLEAVLEQLELPAETFGPPMASLLSLQAGGRYQTSQQNPQQLKEQIMEAAISMFDAMTAQAPVLMVVEDAHWIDPSTIELLSLAIDRLSRSRFMLVIMFRPRFEPPWRSRSNATLLTLNRLGRRDAATMVKKVTGGKELPTEVLEGIVEKTDGVPLYVEELTKTVLESGLLAETSAGYRLTGPLRAFTIPTSLQDSLTARLDNLARAKDTAQLAAVLGRSFRYDILAQVSALDPPELEQALAALVDAQLIYRRGVAPAVDRVAPDTRYEFKHALVQDAAYQSLLKSTRQKIHARIASALESRFREIADLEPELLAHHFAEAGQPARAITYWQRAGQLASAHSGTQEAIAHLTKALDLVNELPDTAERARQELTLYITLGPALMAAEGWAAPAVGQAYERARELCRRVGEPAQLFTVTWGLWLHYEQGGNIGVARVLADELLELAEKTGDAEMQLQAHHASWTTQFSLPDLPRCRDHAKQGIAKYSPRKHHSHASLYGGHDPGVCAYAVGSLASWLLGFPDQARERALGAVSLADDLGHAFSRIQAHGIAAYVHQLRREPGPAMEQAKISIGICKEHRIAPHYLASGTVIKGWSAVVTGKVEAGLAAIRTGLGAYRETKMGLRQAYFVALFAEACGVAGQADEGLEALNNAFEFIKTSGEQSWNAELHRLKGELLLKRTPETQQEAEACIKKAIEIAKTQEAKGWELRAATSLARHWRDQGRTTEAGNILAPVYDWYGEGFDTADLSEAKALLDELG